MVKPLNNIERWIHDHLTKCGQNLTNTSHSVSISLIADWFRQMVMPRSLMLSIGETGGVILRWVPEIQGPNVLGGFEQVESEVTERHSVTLAQ